MRHRREAGWIRGLCLGGLLALAGCASHASTMHDVRAALRHHDLEEARARLAEAGRGTDDLLFALEDGLLLYYAGDPELSNDRFEFAERRVDDLYTESITRAVLSLVSSDLVLRFEPRGIENFLVNYYRAFNYLELGEPEEAWVEWRKLGWKLQFSREQGDALYLDPPFFSYVAGLGLEADDPNDAYIAFRRAEASYRERGAGAPPPELIDDLIRLAHDLGFSDHLELYLTCYGERAAALDQALVSAGGRAARADWGELVVFVEDGLVAPIEEVQVQLPITRGRAELVASGGEGAHLDLAAILAREYAEGRFAGIEPRYARRRGIAYLMPISLPVFGLGQAAFGRVAAVVGNDTAAAWPALQVSALQQLAFQDRLLGIYAKTIARALVKYAAAAKLREEAEEEGGETAGDVVGILANLVNVITERADTRAWLGLPHRIWMARLRVPPGRREVRLLFDGREAVTLGEVEVTPGDRQLLSYRVF
ncbi:MAG: hypothetical protein AMS25_08835 [Gemmatimonas sp. SM23_52]|nr:MAG: hypothetical protein AMS25_08835 [Gemmatimonas sp. SM23_52]